MQQLFFLKYLIFNIPFAFLQKCQILQLIQFYECNMDSEQSWNNFAVQNNLNQMGTNCMSVG